jgi:hypothetical protein
MRCVFKFCGLLTISELQNTHVATSKKKKHISALILQASTTCEIVGLEYQSKRGRPLLNHQEFE